MLFDINFEILTNFAVYLINEVTTLGGLITYGSYKLLKRQILIYFFIAFNQASTSHLFLIRHNAKKKKTS